MSEMLALARLSLDSAENYDEQADERERQFGQILKPTLRAREATELQIAQTQALIGILEALTEPEDFAPDGGSPEDDTCDDPAEPDYTVNCFEPELVTITLRGVTPNGREITVDAQVREWAL